MRSRRQKRGCPEGGRVGGRTHRWTARRSSDERHVLHDNYAMDVGRSATMRRAWRLAIAATWRR